MSGGEQDILILGFILGAGLAGGLFGYLVVGALIRRWRR